MRRLVAVGLLISLWVFYLLSAGPHGRKRLASLQPAGLPALLLLLLRVRPRRPICPCCHKGTR